MSKSGKILRDKEIEAKLFRKLDELRSAIVLAGGSMSADEIRNMTVGDLLITSIKNNIILEIGVDYRNKLTGLDFW